MHLFWIGLGVGTAVGTVGYYLYDKLSKYFSTVYTLGEQLYAKAKGDVQAAKAHIQKLV